MQKLHIFRGPKSPKMAEIHTADVATPLIKGPASPPAGFYPFWLGWSFGEAHVTLTLTLTLIKFLNELY